MRCKTAEHYISRKLDNELKPKHEAQLQKHLARCASCQQLTQDYRSLQKQLQRAELPEFPAFLHHRILNNLPKRSRATELRRFRLSMAATALSIVLSIGAGTLVGLKGYEGTGLLSDYVSEEVIEQPLFGENSLMVVSYDD
jgi:predicted anti-sigma-YlaC factor YlaD